MKNYSTKKIILGIESSCDDTSVAVVREDTEILSHETFSSSTIHQNYGGIVPEIAAREHLGAISPLIKRSLANAQISLSNIDGVAATGGPGLIGGLIVGTMIAKAISSAGKIPFFAINHLEAHALTARLTDKIKFPYLLLLVSGGHTKLIAVLGVGKYLEYGTTLDDAAGEVLDKCSILMKLGFPGGPMIEKHAKNGLSEKISLPRPRINSNDCDFSFSGLKTAFSQLFSKTPNNYKLENINNFSAALQNAITECLISRTRNAIIKYSDEFNSKQLVLSGGVGANLFIRNSIENLAESLNFKFIVPPAELCTDNGAMIAWAGLEYMKLNKNSSLDFSPLPKWSINNKNFSPLGKSNVL